MIALINALLALLGKIRRCRRKPKYKPFPTPLPVADEFSEFGAFRSDASLY